MEKEILQIKKDSNNSLYLTINEYPYTICKVVKFMNINNTIDDFKTKQVNYIIKQVPGFRIFLIQSGFSKTPQSYINDEIIEDQINKMASWYLENKTKSKRERNNYQIKI